MSQRAQVIQLFVPGGNALERPENAARDLTGRALVIRDRAGIHPAEVLMVEVMEPIDASPSGGGA